jgi:hypothetical protein
MPRSTALRNHLLVGARESARAALDGMTAQSAHDVAITFVNTGMALEFMLRAAVARLAPSLLFVPRNVFDKKYAAAMVRSHTDPTTDVSWLLSEKSVDIALVRRVAAKVCPPLDAFEVEIEDILNRRNAAVHMWAADSAALRGTVSSLVRVAATVVDHLGIDPARFWGDRQSLAESLLFEEQNAVRVEVEIQVREAQRRVEQLRAGLDLEEAERVISTIERNGSPFVPPGPTEPFHTECPSCTRRAEVYVRVADDLSDLDAVRPVGWDDDGVPTAVTIPREALAVMLQCPVCRLRLNYPELQAAFPELADLTTYEIEPREGTLSEYDEIMVLHEPDWEVYPHGPQVG